jgi:hypothetical protein
MFRGLTSTYLNRSAYVSRLQRLEESYGLAVWLDRFVPPQRITVIAIRSSGA